MPARMLLGRIGYGEAVDLTVVGNAVNVASRLEAVAKQKGFQIVMSSDVATYAGCLDDAGPVLIVNVRGVDAPMEVIGVMRGRDLPASILAAARAEGPKTTAQRLKREPAATPCDLRQSASHRAQGVAGDVARARKAEVDDDADDEIGGHLGAERTCGCWRSSRTFRHQPPTVIAAAPAGIDHPDPPA